MNKSELKSKMIIECANGYRFLVVDDILLRNDGVMYLDTYNEELKHNSDSDWDVVVVYQSDVFGWGLKHTLDYASESNVIWKRNKEIDWLKVPKWTKVKVRDYKDGKWINEYFLQVVDDSEYPFETTLCDEFTYNPMEKNRYKYIKLYDDTKSPEEWFKNNSI